MQPSLSHLHRQEVCRAPQMVRALDCQINIYRIRTQFCSTHCTTRLCMSAASGAKPSTDFAFSTMKAGYSSADFGALVWLWRRIKGYRRGLSFVRAGKRKRVSDRMAWKKGRRSTVILDRRLLRFSTDTPPTPRGCFPLLLALCVVGGEIQVS